MDLIDRDALKYDPLPKADRNYRTYNLDDAYEDGYSDAMVDVSNAPVINAIPISWLEDFRDGLDTLSESQLMRAIDLIIDAYRAEKKRKEE